VPEVAVVPILSSGGEPTPCRHKRSRAPVRYWKANTFALGAISPSFVWLPISLSIPRIFSAITGRKIKNLESSI
jgi:hypothetical protein